jgi:S1-C subfamily serine protease
MSRRLSVAVFLLLCFTTTEARAAPWHPHPGGEKRASGPDKGIGSAADYIRTLNRAVPLSRIGVSVRDGRTELVDGHEVNGVEVIDAAAEAGFVATILTSAIPLLGAIDHNFMFDDRDLIFAADGERVRNILELADRVQSLARGDRIYLTIARRGQRIQICMTASSP